MGTEKPTKRRSRKRETHTCHWIDIIIGITWNTCKSITFCMTILCTECRSKSKIQKHTASHSINLLRRYLCACAMCVCLRVLANSKCIFIQHSSVRLFVNVDSQAHTQHTDSSSECVVLTVEWASLENKLWFSSSANMRALSPDFLLCVKRIAAAKVYLHMIRTILVLIDSLLRAQRFSIVCSKQVRAACASTSLFSTVFIFHCWFWVLVQLH